MIAVSSGSTGKPLAWPRSLRDELEIATRFEQVFAQGFGVQRHPTLVVICFALGSWVGGMYTAQCCSRNQPGNRWHPGRWRTRERLW
jgi:phenylacetate-CoA ligase